ncbi:PAS domain S-box protein, partial [bacterium]|nr:PAS domain S-box protein [bacterium]
MKQMLRLLIVEDSENDALLTVREVQRAGYDIVYRCVETRDAMEAALTEDRWDAIIADYSLPSFSALEALEIMKNKDLDLPFIIFSGTISDKAAVQAMKAGAHDYIMKHDLARLIPAVERELREADVRKEQKVTEQARSQIEETLRKRNRTLRMLSDVSQALIHATNEHELLEYVCQIICGTGNYRMVWIGIAQHDHAKSIQPIYSGGCEEGYLNDIKVTWSDTLLGQSPTGKALRTGKVVVAHDIATDPDFAPWREEALKRGYKSVISIPLVSDGNVLGALNIYSSQIGEFDEDEIMLLTELAGDLAYGIASLRSRKEAKRAQQELADSEERYRQLFATISDAVVLVDGETMQHNDVNDAALEMYGYSRNEFLALKITDISAEPEETRNLIQTAVCDKRAIIRIEVRYHIKKGGIKFPTELSAGCFVAKGHNMVWLIIRDITSRKLAEDALVESEHRLFNIIEFLPDATLVIDRKGRLIAWNKAMEQLSHTPAKDVLGKDNHEYALAFYGERRPGLVDLALNPDLDFSHYYSMITRRDDTFVAEAHIPSLDNGAEFVLITAAPLYDSEGNVVGAIEQIHDITERKRLEEHKREFYRKTILAATEGKLLICEHNEIIMIAGPTLATWDVKLPSDVGSVRQVAAEIAKEAGMSDARIDDFVLAIGEAATNAIKHANGGIASLHRASNGLTFVMSDQGHGIDAINLPEVALTRGYTTAASLGMGYKAMI